MSTTDDSTPDNYGASMPASTERDEAPARRQVGQRVALHLEGTPAPLEVSIDNRDRIAFEKVQNKRGWPKAADAQNLAMTFVCWSAAKRTGQTALTYEVFEQQLVDYDVLEDEPADPTR